MVYVQERRLQEVSDGGVGVSYPPFAVWPPVSIPDPPPSAAASEYFALNETWDAASDEFTTAVLNPEWIVCNTAALGTPIVPAQPIDPTAAPNAPAIWLTPNAHGSWMALQAGSGDCCVRRVVASRPSLFQLRWRFQLPTMNPPVLGGTPPAVQAIIARDNGSGLPNLLTSNVAAFGYFTDFPPTPTTYYGPAAISVPGTFIPGWYIRMSELNAGSGNGHCTDYPVFLPVTGAAVNTPYPFPAMDLELIWAAAGTVGWWYLRSPSGLQIQQGVHGGNPNNWLNQVIAGTPMHVVSRYIANGTSMQPGAMTVFNTDYVRSRSDYVVY